MAALLKYIGTIDKSIILNGTKKHLKPGTMFSGPSHLKEFKDEFILLSESADKEDKSKKDISSDNLKLTATRSKFYPKVDFSFFNENSLPTVSICIITKNNYSVIKRCIDSLLEHVKYTQYEILICDTGTTELEVLDFYKTLEGKENIKIFRDQKYNFSKNNNFLVKMSSGEALLFLNNDVFVTYDIVSEMVKYINCSNMGCVGHRMVWESQPTKIQHDGQVLYNSDGVWIGPGHHSYRMDVENISSDNVIVEGVTAACLMVRKSIFDKVGGFDERYLDVYQDVDFNLKVSALGLINFCIRKNFIFHVDHSTRKEDNSPESVRDFQLFKMTWVNRGRYPVKKSPVYSIVVCATKEKDLKGLYDSIKTTDEYELIFVNNNKNYMCSSVALNVLTEVSKGEIIFYTHQDVSFDLEEPFSKIDQIISRVGSNFGVLGPAGVQYNGGHYVKGVNFSASKYTFDTMKVQTIDEYCFITKRSNKLRFGEYLDHFHFYGADLCCEAMSKGLFNYVINVDIMHHSGGDDNLKTGDGYERYMDSARKFYRRWGKKHPKISTTTARFENGHVLYFLAHQLGLHPYEEDIIV